jgi:hypothetical protein
MIENKVAKSGLITLDFAELVQGQEAVALDIAPWLWQGLVLKEKDFRETVTALDVSPFEGKIVGVYCSNDAIVPVWAFMLLALKLEPVATSVVFASEKELDLVRANWVISQLNAADYEGKNVIIKGCTSLDLNPEVYVNIAAKLRSKVNRLMFGEPCSTVPLYKK